MAWQGTKIFNSQSYYNIEELNRVNNNISFLADLLNSYLISVTPPRPIVTSRTTKDLPYVRYFNEAKYNIKALIESYYPVSVPTPIIDTEDIISYSYNNVNQLEVNLQAVYDMIVNMEKGFKYAGTFSCGQEVTL